MTTTQLTAQQQPAREQRQLEQWSTGKAMEFHTSDDELPPNVAPAQKREPPHREAENSVHFGHSTNARKHSMKYQTCGQQTTDRYQLAKKGICLLSNKPGHMARDCTTR